VEWGRLYNQKRDPGVTALNTDIFLNGLFNDLKKDNRCRYYDWTSKVMETRMAIRHGEELYFIIKSAMCWLLDCADGGAIVVDEMAAREPFVSIGIRMVSNSLLKNLARSIEEIRRVRLWPDNADTPVDGLAVRLARDVAMARNGDLTIDLKSNDVIEIHIRANVF
jgi:hypothetical protein